MQDVFSRELFLQPMLFVFFFSKYFYLISSFRIILLPDKDPQAFGTNDISKVIRTEDFCTKGKLVLK